MKIFWMEGHAEHELHLSSNIQSFRVQGKGTGWRQKMDTGKRIAVNPTVSCFYCCSVTVQTKMTYL